MRYLLGDKNADWLEMEIISVDRTEEKSNAVIDMYVKSGSYAGDGRFVVDYTDFVLFFYHMGMLADGDEYIVPELLDRGYGSSVDVAETVGGLIYDDRSDGYQSIEFDFPIEAAKIADFVGDLRTQHFTRRSVGGMEFDLFLTALVRLMPQTVFSLRGPSGFEKGRMGHAGPRWKTRSKPVRKGPFYWVEIPDDSQEIRYYDTLKDFLSAPLYGGKTLEEVWNRVEILTLDGKEPRDVILEGFTRLAQD